MIDLQKILRTAITSRKTIDTRWKSQISCYSLEKSRNRQNVLFYCSKL